MRAQNIRVIPLLILVAMLAFSVRLVDFALGVSAMSGSAFAEEKAVASSPPQEELKTAMADAPQEQATQEKIEEEGESLEIPPSSTGTSSSAGKGIEWRDAKDEVMEMTNVHKEVFDDLVQRKEALDEREQGLVTREALLKAAEQELNQKYRELQVLRGDIEGLLNKQSDEEQQRIASLVKIYEGMKPKDAANIFNTLDLDVLVSVMGRMSERKLSPIIASMNPERARTITIMLAEEKQLPELPE